MKKIKKKKIKKITILNIKDYLALALKVDDTKTLKFIAISNEYESFECILDTKKNEITIEFTTAEMVLLQEINK